MRGCRLELAGIVGLCTVTTPRTLELQCGRNTLGPQVMLDPLMSLRASSLTYLPLQPRVGPDEAAVEPDATAGG